MPGPHGFAVRKQYRSSTDTPRPSHPASYVRDDRDTPLCNGGGTPRDLTFILIFRNGAGLRQIGTTGNVRLMARLWPARLDVWSRKKSLSINLLLESEIASSALVLLSIRVLITLLQYGNLMPAKSKAAATFVYRQGDVLDVLKTLPPKKYGLIISSPPYNIGKGYEKQTNFTFEQYVEWLDGVVGELVKHLAETGSMCWQVGSYIKDGEIFPLDLHFYQSFKKRGLHLRNRIVWRFNFGLHSTKRFSGRYETLLWFTRSDKYTFNLDPVRVPQLYPGKRHSDKKGKDRRPSGNPLGKNPSDYWEFSAKEYFKDNPVWEIPNVKANHPEKTIHPCQFPTELVERCVLALTAPGDSVLDPFVGTGTSVIAALKHGRNAVGIDKEAAFIKLANESSVNNCQAID
jgi:adenine-specific DNA-methyltransferase